MKRKSTNKGKNTMMIQMYFTSTTSTDFVFRTINL